MTNKEPNDKVVQAIATLVHAVTGTAPQDGSKRTSAVRKRRRVRRKGPWRNYANTCDECGRLTKHCVCSRKSLGTVDDASSTNTVEDYYLDEDSASVSTFASSARRSRHLRPNRGNGECSNVKHRHRHHHHHHHHKHHEPPCPPPYGCYSGSRCVDNACAYRRQISQVCGANGCYLAETDVLSCPTRPCWAPGGVSVPISCGAPLYGCSTSCGISPVLPSGVPLCGTAPSVLNGSLLPVNEQTIFTPDVVVQPSLYV